MKKGKELFINPNINAKCAQKGNLRGWFYSVHRKKDDSFIYMLVRCFMKEK